MKRHMEFLVHDVHAIMLLFSLFLLLLLLPPDSTLKPLQPESPPRSQRGLVRPPSGRWDSGVVPAADITLIQVSLDSSGGRH